VSGVTWSSLQSMLQVIAGLNIAYYAFKEIRMPIVSRLLSDINGLKDQLDRDRSNDELSDLPGHRVSATLENRRHTETLLLKIKALQLDIEVSTFMRGRYFDVERLLTLPSLFIGVCAIGLLVSSVFTYDDKLPLAWAIVIIAIGLAPAAAYLVINFLILSEVQRYRSQLTDLVIRRDNPLDQRQ
jgi:hypothetical protein